MSRYLGDLHVEEVLADDPPDGGEADPEVVGVEHIELLHGHEVLEPRLRHLRHLQQPQLALVLDQSAALQTGGKNISTVLLLCEKYLLSTKIFASLP